jgi:hypothetical protein
MIIVIFNEFIDFQNNKNVINQFINKKNKTFFVIGNKKWK